MKFWRSLEVIGSLALLTCVVGIVLLSMIRPHIQSAFHAVAEQDINAFLSGKTDIYKGYDYAGTR